MIKEDQSNDLNQKLVPYNDFLRELAKEKKCLLADLNADMQAALKVFPADAPKGTQLTRDGVHMNAYGNHMMASGILRAFGVPEARLKELVKEWKSIPGSRSIRVNLSMSLAEYEAVAERRARTRKPYSQKCFRIRRRNCWENSRQRHAVQSRTFVISLTDVISSVA